MPAPSQGVQVSGSCFTSDGKMEREIDGRIGAAACSKTGATPGRLGKEGVKSKGEALSLPGGLHSDPHHVVTNSGS